MLIPVVLREPEPTLLLTRRHEDISFPGHIAFPGGRADPADRSPEQTALRESEEEIALSPSAVDVIGRLGDYVTHSGYRIAPIVGLVRTPVQLAAREGEVEEILEIPLALAFDSASYRLRRSPGDEPRAHYFLRHGDVIVAGPTVSLMMGLYEELLVTHPPRAGAGRGGT